MMKEPRGSHAYRRGIRGYSERVVQCRVCGRLTNVLWRTPAGACVVVCGDECAHDYDIKREEEAQRQ